MAEYTKDKRFSWGWVTGGTILMFLTNLLGGLAVLAAGVTDMYAVAAVAVACFALAGFVIGWKSEGQTILEAGVAAVAALGLSFAFRRVDISADRGVIAVGFAIPFVAAIAGAWLGEKVQGDIIITKDD